MVFYVKHKGFSVALQHSVGIINYNVDSKILMRDGGFYEVQGKYSASILYAGSTKSFEKSFNIWSHKNFRLNHH